MPGERPLLSLIIPAYNEVESVEEIAEFYRDIQATHPAVSFELIVVDDGSTDNTKEELLKALSGAGTARVVSLSRNFGSHAGISAGLFHARGDAALTLSADRQEPLGAITSFIQEWQDGGELIWGLRATRAQGGFVSDAFAHVFSRFYSKHSDIPQYPSEGPSQILITRPVIDALNAMPELNRNIMAMAAWVGFDQRKIYYEQLARPHGRSKWTTSRKLKLVVDSFVEFSHAPLQWLAWSGLLIGGIGGILLILAAALALNQPFGAAVALLSGLVLFSAGIVLVGLGILGEYIWRLGDDARRRPVFIVRSTSQIDSKNAPSAGKRNEV